MRIMHNTTLREEFREFREKHARLIAAAYRAAAVALVLVFAAVFVVFPDAVLGLIIEYWSYGVVAACSLGLAQLLPAKSKVS